MTQATRRRSPLYLVTKRVIDVLVSMVGLLLLMPLLLMLAILVRLDSAGPSLFVQKRVGRYGRQFTMYKFRTMYITAPIYAYKPNRRTDARVTRLGRILRSTSLDEFPQLYNVLRGDMSLVGPRPEMPFIVESYQPWQHNRHNAQPGITGWWQVQARGDGPMHEHTDLDLYYVEHQSLALDLSILWLTTLAVLNMGKAV